MCEVIQLLYSNDQYQFNGQMRTVTGLALVLPKTEYVFDITFPCLSNRISKLHKTVTFKYTRKYMLSRNLYI